MTTARSQLASQCLLAAYDATMDFPSIVRTLLSAGFEGNQVDYRAQLATYYHGDGSVETVPLPDHGGYKVAPQWVPAQVRAAIAHAQSGDPSYTYQGFCETVTEAGCAGYFASFAGQRVLYFSRGAEVHVEHFPRS